MKINYKITNEFKERYISTNFDVKNKTILRSIVFIASIILLFISLIALISQDYSLFIVPLVIALSGFYITFLPRILKKKYIKSLDFNNENIVEVNESDLTIVSSSRTTTFNYSQVKEIYLVSNYFIFIRFRPGDSIVIPKYAFSDDTETIDFINKIKINAKIL